MADGQTGNLCGNSMNDEIKINGNVYCKDKPISEIGIDKVCNEMVIGVFDKKNNSFTSHFVVEDIVPIKGIKTLVFTKYYYKPGETTIGYASACPISNLNAKIGFTYYSYSKKEINDKVVRDGYFQNIPLQNIRTGNVPLMNLPDSEGALITAKNAYKKATQADISEINNINEMIKKASERGEYSLFYSCDENYTIIKMQSLYNKLVNYGYYVNHPTSNPGTLYISWQHIGKDKI